MSKKLVGRFQRKLIVKIEECNDNNDVNANIVSSIRSALKQLSCKSNGEKKKRINDKKQYVYNCIIKASCYKSGENKSKLAGSLDIYRKCAILNRIVIEKVELRLKNSNNDDNIINSNDNYDGMIIESDSELLDDVDYNIEEIDDDNLSNDSISDSDDDSIIDDSNILHGGNNYGDFCYNCIPPRKTYRNSIDLTPVINWLHSVCTYANNGKFCLVLDHSNSVYYTHPQMYITETHLTDPI